ncbi:MAG: hypothetical protein FWC64_07470 [Treponema sp.]|nr:hypothetical protein [Treponema sp.]
MKKHITGILIAILCMALFAACPNRVTFPAPSITISTGGDDSAIVTRGGALTLDASVHDLGDIFQSRTIVWSIVEYEDEDEQPSGPRGRDTSPSYEDKTSVSSTGGLSARFTVDRNSPLAYSTLTVRARLKEHPHLYTTRTFTVIDPVAVVSGVDITSVSLPGVHRGASSGVITAEVAFDGPPPIRGNRGVHFVISQGGAPGTTVSPVAGSGERAGTVLVSPSQPYGAGLYVQAVSNYDTNVRSAPFPIDVLRPVAQTVVVGLPARVGADGGLHRGETNRFTATVLGLGNPPQTVAWDFAAPPPDGVEIDPVTGDLSVSNDAAIGASAVVRAISEYSPPGAVVAGTSSPAILRPVVTSVRVTGPSGETAADGGPPSRATVQRGDTGISFHAVVEGRGNPTPDMREVYWSVPVPGTNHQTRIASGGVLSVSEHEFLDVIRVRATSRENPRAIDNMYVDITGGSLPADGWRMVSVGEYHALALTADNRLFSWGRNNSGQLGNGEANGSNVTSPAEVARPALQWRMISAGQNHNIAITDDNRLFGWGSNAHGQLGRPPAVGNELIPGNIAGAIGHSWITADVGPRHTVGIKEQGTLYTFGANDPALLGRDQVSQPGAGIDGELRPHWQPGRVRVAGLSDYGWKSASAGTDHSAAIRVDGSLWVWGRNEWGQLGTGNAGSSRTPVRIAHPGGHSWESVNAGDRFTIAIDDQGKLWSWGRNELGQLGQSDPPSQHSPLNPYDGQGGGRWWNYINSVTNHSIVMDRDGYLFIFGSNNLGQFGNGFHVSDTMPGIMMVPVRAADRFLFANAGGNSSMAVSEDGKLWAWGDNRFGQLGIGRDNPGAARYFEVSPQLVEQP